MKHIMRKLVLQIMKL